MRTLLMLFMAWCSILYFITVGLEMCQHARDEQEWRRQQARTAAAIRESWARVGKLKEYEHRQRELEAFNEEVRRAYPKENQ